MELLRLTIYVQPIMDNCLVTHRDAQVVSDLRLNGGNPKMEFNSHPYYYSETFNDDLEDNESHEYEVGSLQKGSD